jgi:serine/threonine-protein kinase
MAAVAADRHLLLGLLALQNGLIQQAQLVAAFHAWTCDKARSLSDHLVALGHLNAAQRAAVEALAAVHIEAHGGVDRSLAAVPVGGAARADLARLGDPDIGATLSHVGSGRGPDDPDRRADDSVGSATSDGQRFRILRPHARGGLGAVSVAFDGELRREVALKQILDEHADDPDSRRRFLAEAEITGGLEHPGIVPVYGLGADARGRPYYAMRLIRGESLQAALARFRADEALKSDPGRRSLDLRRLLRRFTDVCDAVEYAHSRGVIHRDLKPANIVVGRHGETLVVDWGLAKSVGRADPSAGERTIAPSSSGSSETLPGSALGTPSYMSPEQARGELDRLGPRSDVYGLGTTLYCLLTGRAPFEGENVGAVLGAVREGEFARPTRVDSSIDPALEAICLKAMALRPEDRYATPRSLAEDVERWMADEPVSAWHEPRVRALLRWLTRHRTGVTAAAAAMVVGAIGLGVIALVQTKARRDLTAANQELKLQRRRAEDRETQAIDAVKRFRDALVDERELKNSPALENLRKRLLKEPLTFFRTLRDRLQADRETRPESLQRLAEASRDLAALTAQIGDKRDALAALREALEIWQKLAAGSPDAAGIQDDLANCHMRIGILLSEIGRQQEARRAFEVALATASGLARANPGVTQFRRGLANIQNHLGSLLREIGQPKEALEEQEAALAIRRELAEAHPGRSELQMDLARSYNSVANILSETGQPGAAMTAYEASLKIRQVLAGARPDETEFQSALADSHFSIGVFLREARRLREALGAFEDACVIQRKLADANPTVTHLQNGLARSLTEIGLMSHSLGRLDDSMKAYTSALAIQQRLADLYPSITSFQRQLAGSYNHIGLLLSLTGRPDEARKPHEANLAIYRKLIAIEPESPDVASNLACALDNVADLDRGTRRFEQARQGFREAIAWQKKALSILPDNAPYWQLLAVHLSGLKDVCHDLGDSQGEAQAERELVRARDSDPFNIALDARLAKVTKGDAAPRDNDERVQMAQRAYQKRLHAASARLWSEAFAADPKRVDDRLGTPAYDAACAAALAGVGQGNDDPRPAEATRAKLREQALHWLQAELSAWRKEARTERVLETLKNWTQDEDLAGVREASALEKLPEDERRAWRQLWRDVEILRQQAAAP